MSYRIRMVAEVAGWLSTLREADPGTAEVVDEALGALRDQGASLGLPLVMPVEARPEQTRPGLDDAYQRQLAMLTRMRRAVADMATARKRLELQIQQHEQLVTRLGEQRIKDLQAGRSDLAAEVGARLPIVGAQLADLRRQVSDVQSEEDRLSVASRRLQHKVDDFRTRKEAARAAEAAAEAAAQAAEAEAEIEGVIAAAGAPDQHRPPSPVNPGRQARPSWLPLSELRPGAPGPSGVRILFTVEPSGPGTGPSGTAVLLAAGTERDWLEAWYAEAIHRCRARYERDQGGTG
jgi:hypothetical protein